MMTNQKTPAQATSIKGITPVLSVFNMPASIRFYRDLLGFNLLDTSAPTEKEDHYQWALLGVNGIELLLEPRGEKCCPKPITANAWLDRHDMSLHFSCTDLDALYNDLRENGADVQAPAFTSYGYKAIEIRDPDGFLLIFHTLPAQ